MAIRMFASCRSRIVGPRNFHIMGILLIYLYNLILYFQSVAHLVILYSIEVIDSHKQKVI